MREKQNDKSEGEKNDKREREKKKRRNMYVRVQFCVSPVGISTTHITMKKNLNQFYEYKFVCTSSIPFF